MKSAQAVFNKVIRHLRKQGVRAYIEGEGCAYRAPNGTMCAVGCLIPDELYSPQMEGQSVLWLTKYAHDPKAAEAVLGPRLLLEYLQSLHDSTMVDGWNDYCEARAQRIADTFGLEMP